MDQAADPVTQSIAYREMELAALGTRDPAEVQAETPRRVRELLSRRDSRGEASATSDEWSPKQLVAHLADVEIIFSGRYRWILAHDRPPLIGFDQNLWMQHLHGPDDDTAELLAAFDALRALNVRLWRRASQSERERVAVHPERGDESFDVCFRMVAGHDLLHLDQMARAVDLACER